MHAHPGRTNMGATIHRKVSICGETRKKRLDPVDVYRGLNGGDILFIFIAFRPFVALNNETKSNTKISNVRIEQLGRRAGRSATVCTKRV